MFVSRLPVDILAIKRVLFLATVLALAAVLAGCSSSDEGGGSGSTSSTSSDQSPPTAAGDTSSESGGSQGGEIDACSILLPEDVEAEIGVSPEPNGDAVGPFQNCIYFDTASTFVQFQACYCLTDSQFDDSVKAGAEALEIELMEVDGVGDKAYWYGGILWVQRGDLALSVWISKPSYYSTDGTALEGEELDAVALPEAKALALKLMGRID